MKTLLGRAQVEGTPLIDGESVTFIWHAPRASQLIADFTGWESGAPLELAELEQGVWGYTLVLPRDAYIEYTYLLDGARVLDPLNPRTTPNGMGDTNNFFYMPAGQPTSLARRKRGVPRGTVTKRVVVADDLVIGNKRPVYLYQPPTEEPAALLVVFDGQDYLRRARLPQMLDNLIAQGRICPLALALVQNGGRKGRMIEYACNECTLGFLVYHVLPLARAELNLVEVGQRPGAYGVLGASMGGLSALYTALRLPAIFGHVLSQSGTFTLGEYDTVVFDLVREGSVKPLQIWMDVGKFEWLLDANRRMHALLAQKGYPVIYREYNAGHNYPAWRDDLWQGLEGLFGVNAQESLQTRHARD
jgi:enterochelin esterase-like enzyme